MKKIKRILSLVIAVVIIATAFSSCSITDKEPQFKENANGMAFYRYKSASTETVYEIPDTYADKPLTELMDFSFANAEYLKELYIGKNIETISVWAFTNCPVLEKFVVSEDNPNFKTVDGVLYNKDMTEIIAYPNGKTPIERDAEGKIIKGGTIVLPETVKTIRENAFYRCSNLYSITFNEGLEVIGNKAFIKCGNLAEIKLPSTLKELGADAFSYNDSLKIVEIPSSVQKIGDFAFYSTASQIEKIIVHKNSEAELELGERWVPYPKGNIKDTVSVEYVGA